MAEHADGAKPSMRGGDPARAEEARRLSTEVNARLAEIRALAAKRDTERKAKKGEAT